MSRLGLTCPPDGETVHGACSVRKCRREQKRKETKLQVRRHLTKPHDLFHE